MGLVFGVRKVVQPLLLRHRLSAVQQEVVL